MDDEWQAALQEEQSGESALSHSEGVGGWLLYFCIVSVFISPLASLNAILKPVNGYWFICYMVLVIFSISAGIATLAKSQAAFNLIRLDLMTRVFYGVAQIGWALHLRSLHQSAVLVGSELGRAVATLLGVVLWFSYFKVSTRVMRTLGRHI